MFIFKLKLFRFHCLMSVMTIFRYLNYIFVGKCALFTHSKQSNVQNAVSQRGNHKSTGSGKLNAGCISKQTVMLFFVVKLQVASHIFPPKFSVAL